MKKYSNTQRTLPPRTLMLVFALGPVVSIPFLNAITPPFSYCWVSKCVSLLLCVTVPGSFSPAHPMRTQLPLSACAAICHPVPWVAFKLTIRNMEEMPFSMCHSSFPSTHTAQGLTSHSALQGGSAWPQDAAGWPGGGAAPVAILVISELGKEFSFSWPLLVTEAASSHEPHPFRFKRSCLQTLELHSFPVGVTQHVLFPAQNWHRNI